MIEKASLIQKRLLRPLEADFIPCSKLGKTHILVIFSVPWLAIEINCRANERPPNGDTSSHQTFEVAPSSFGWVQFFKFSIFFTKWAIFRSWLRQIYYLGCVNHEKIVIILEWLKFFSVTYSIYEKSQNWKTEKLPARPCIVWVKLRRYVFL